MPALVLNPAGLPAALCPRDALREGALPTAWLAVAVLMRRGNDQIKALKKTLSSWCEGNLTKRKKAGGPLTVAPRPQPSGVFCVWGALGNCGSWVSIRLSLENGITPQPSLGRHQCHCLACARPQISGNSFLSYLRSVRAKELQFQQPLAPGLTLGKQLCYKYLPDEVKHQYP